MIKEKEEDKGKTILALLERINPIDVSKSLLRKKNLKKILSVIMIKTAKKIFEIVT